MSKKQNRINRQNGLLQEFSHQEKDYYEERKIGNEWYIKSWNGGTHRWQVSIYSEQSYSRYKSYGENKREFDYKLNKEENDVNAANDMVDGNGDMIDMDLINNGE